MIQEYEVVIETELPFFLKTIREMMADGWEPLGSIQLGEDYYCREMVKYDDVSFSKMD